MWDTFVPDLLVALVGAIFTVAIALGTYMVKIRQDEKQAIQSLINELHRRRALRPTVDQVVAGAAESDDFVRVSASVASIRAEVRSARERVRHGEQWQAPLSAMTRACNRYLSLSAAHPDAYVIYLGDLRRELTASVNDLASRKRGVIPHEPGLGAD